MAIGAYVTDVSASDRDINENAFRDYNIPDSPDGNFFRMDSIRSTGAGSVKIGQV